MSAREQQIMPAGFQVKPIVWTLSTVQTIPNSRLKRLTKILEKCTPVGW